MSQYDLKLDHKVNVGHSDLILQSSNFACYLEEYFIYKYLNLWIVSQYDLKFEAKINVEHSEIHFLIQYINFYLEDYLMYKHTCTY